MGILRDAFFYCAKKNTRAGKTDLVLWKINHIQENVAILKGAIRHYNFHLYYTSKLHAVETLVETICQTLANTHFPKSSHAGIRGSTPLGDTK